jgi:hypothetical protein
MGGPDHRNIGTTSHPFWVDVGQEILDAGKGFGIWPKSLRHYAGVLRLKPPLQWMMVNLMSFSWEWDAPSEPPLQWLAQEMNCDRVSVRGWIDQLIALGYIIPLEDRRDDNGNYAHRKGNGGDTPMPYDLRPFSLALVLAAAIDPNSPLSIERGAPLDLDAPARFGFDFDLEKARKLRGLDDPSSDAGDHMDDDGAEDDYDDGVTDIDTSDLDETPVTALEVQA